jgi:hypothetical protein
VWAGLLAIGRHDTSPAAVALTPSGAAGRSTGALHSHTRGDLAARGLARVDVPPISQPDAATLRTVRRLDMGKGRARTKSAAWDRRTVHSDGLRDLVPHGVCVLLHKRRRQAGNSR